MHISPTLALLVSFVNLALGTPLDTSPMVIQKATDAYLFSTSMTDFQIAKHIQAGPAGLNWTDDGCSGPTPPGIFELSCSRHDFGYRNYSQQGRCSDHDRETIDSNFENDMRHECETMPDRGLQECYDLADVYHEGVRAFGWNSFCTGDFADHDDGLF
jgi:hypothetical protein